MCHNPGWRGSCWGWRWPQVRGVLGYFLKAELIEGTSGVRSAPRAAQHAAHAPLQRLPATPPLLPSQRGHVAGQAGASLPLPACAAAARDHFGFFVLFCCLRCMALTTQRQMKQSQSRLWVKGAAHIHHYSSLLAGRCAAKQGCRCKPRAAWSPDTGSSGWRERPFPRSGDSRGTAWAQLLGVGGADPGRVPTGLQLCGPGICGTEWGRGNASNCHLLQTAGRRSCAGSGEGPSPSFASAGATFAQELTRG